MHISHVQSVQVYASPSFDAVSAWWQAFLSWDFACVLCARDVVTEMAVALHAIGVKCHVHHVAAKASETLARGEGTAERRNYCDPGEKAASSSFAAHCSRETVYQINRAQVGSGRADSNPVRDLGSLMVCVWVVALWGRFELHLA